MSSEDSLIILHTNNIQGNIKNFEKVHSLINEFKGEDTIILDTGDFTALKSEDIYGTEAMKILNKFKNADYDAITVGNNELVYGLNKLENIAGDSEIPFLSCNLKNESSKEIKGIYESIIINKKDVNILIIGSSYSLEENDLNKKTALIRLVKNEIDKHQGKYDICIFNSHLSMDTNREIGHEIPQIDVIISGESSILLDDAELIGSCILNSIGESGKYLGVLEVVIEEEGVKLLSCENISIDDI